VDNVLGSTEEKGQESQRLGFLTGFILWVFP
jgi:hypothetical protein